MFRKHLFFFSFLSLVSQYLNNLNYSKIFFSHLRIRNPSPGSSGGACRDGNIGRGCFGRPPPTPWPHHSDGSRNRSHNWDRFRLLLLVFHIFQFFLQTFFPLSYSLMKQKPFPLLFALPGPAWPQLFPPAAPQY